MKRSKQSRVVDVDKGLILVRYATAENEHRPPKVEVLVNPRDHKHVEIVSNPSHSDAVLWQPGSCLVVRATRPGQLLVDVIPLDDGGSSAATVKVESLGQGESTAARLPVPAALKNTDSDRLRIIGHVAGIGDVTAHADEWIAGPAAPARIEGLSMVWPGKPDNLELRYAVRLARPHALSGKMMPLGSYAGTRGHALPIVAIALEISGAAAADFQLFAEAAFLGAPIARTSGKRIEVSGPTGREPLVGFRIRLDETGIPLQPALAQATQARPAGRVRVFRSRAAQGQLRHAMPLASDATDARAAVE
jgi:hypothetical protein